MQLETSLVLYFYIVGNLIVELLSLFIQDSNLEKPSAEQPSLESVTKNISSDTSESSVSHKLSSSSLTDAQRCMSLYFALCTKVVFYVVLNLAVDTHHLLIILLFFFSL